MGSLPEQDKQRALEGCSPDACGLLLERVGDNASRGMIILDRTPLTDHPKFTPP